MITQSSCFHCGEIIPAQFYFPVQYQHTQQLTCCAGCQAVAQTIITSGLGNYYSQREAFPSRQEAIAPELREQMALFDDTRLQKTFVHFETDEIRDAALIIEGIICSACIWLIERQLSHLSGILAAHINYATHRARIKWDNTQITLPHILEAFVAIGYQAHPYDRAHEENLRQKTRKTALTRLGIAGLSMMQVMMYAVPTYLAAPGSISSTLENLMRWASLILTLPVMGYAALPFYQASLRELKNRRASMDLPVTLSIILTFAASAWATYTQQGDVYFDAISMFVFLLLGGRYLESMARLRTQAATEALVHLIPAFAHHLPAYPDHLHRQEIMVSHIKLGDVIMIKPGEVIPCDAVILEGESQVNEAILSGESRPIFKKPGHAIIAGSNNLDSSLIAQVTHTGEATQLSAIIRLLAHAQAEKPVLAQLADRIAGWFILALLAVASLTFIGWMHYAPTQALWVTAAVLVISCPCALSLATPAAISAVCNRLGREGLLVARASSIETLSVCTAVILDKTGTLTLGQLTLQHLLVRHITAQEAKRLAASLEAHSEHPIAHAFKQPDLINPATDLHHYPGHGITGTIDGQPYAIGTQAFIQQFCYESVPQAWLTIKTTDSQLFLANQRQWLAVFYLRDHLRTDSQSCVTALKQLGLAVHLLSGDSADVVQDTAQKLNISYFAAAQTPQDKLQALQDLQRKGHRVLMVGDGVNDAPVLAAADVSIAMGAGADVTQATSDMILLNNTLTSLPQAVKLARQTRQIIRQNLYWALLYNIIALPLAIAGYVTPWIASVGMASSALLVIFNALRLYPTTRPR
jgi:Cu2+-exporting ATPase